MGLGIRTGGERAAAVTVVLVELHEGPRAQMDVGRSVRALRVAVALELIVVSHPRRTPLGSLYSRRQVRPGSARLVSFRRMPTLPEGPMPRRYRLAVHSSVFPRCGRRRSARRPAEAP